MEPVRAALRSSSAFGAVAWAAERRLPVRKRLMGRGLAGRRGSPGSLVPEDLGLSQWAKERPREFRGRL